MVSRDHAEELAERLTDLQAEIRAEIEASASSDLRSVGVLTYLEEAASLLEQAGLRMGWWLIPAAVGRVCGAEGGRHHGGLLGKLCIEARQPGSYLRAVSLEESRRSLAEPANDWPANDDDRGQREKA